MRIRPLLALLPLLAMSSASYADPLYHVTDLGTGYQLQSDPNGSIHAVTSGSGDATYAFDKSPITYDPNPTVYFNTYSHYYGYQVTTMTDGTASVGYTYDYGFAPPLTNLFLPIFPGHAGYEWGIVPNSSGVPFEKVVGNLGPGENPPVVYKAGTPPVSDFNSQHQAVGAMSDVSGTKTVQYAAFTNTNFDPHQTSQGAIWSANNLNLYIDPIPSVVLTNAFRIDDQGRILAQGDNNHDYLLTPYALGTPTPIPEPTTLAFLGLVGVSLSLRAAYRRVRSR